MVQLVRAGRESGGAVTWSTGFFSNAEALNARQLRLAPWVGPGARWGDRKLNRFAFEFEHLLLPFRNLSELYGACLRTNELKRNPSIEGWAGESHGLPPSTSYLSFQQEITAHEVVTVSHTRRQPRLGDRLTRRAN